MYKVLFFIKVPPPLTGVTLMNQRILNSGQLNSNFNIRSISISYMNNLNKMGAWKFKKLLIIIKLIAKLIYELIFHRPKFIYFQISPHRFAFYRDLIFVSINKLFRVKILYHIHGKGISDHMNDKWRKKLYIYAFKGSDVICLSPLLTYDIENVFEGKVHIVRNGIPDFKLDNLTLVQQLPEEQIKILFLSNLIKSKGVLVFIESMLLLKNEGYRFLATIVGSDVEFSQKELTEIIKIKDLAANIKCVGAKYNEAKNTIIKKADVLVYPTLNDAFPLVLIEAMQFSVPIIATIEGAIPEIIDDGVTGYLVEKNAPQQIVDKLKLLIVNPEHRKEMGQAGRKLFEEKYTIEILEKKMLNIFEEICAE